MQLQDYVDANKRPAGLDEIAARIGEISTLPHIAVTLMEVANDPKSSAADLKAIVENDAALSARILRCVNSSAYGLREKVANLQQAITYLGLKQIRNLALTASVAELFTQAEAIGSYSRRELWRHMVAVGVCSRLIAMRQGMPDFEDVFAAGLLHDIGLVLEDQYAHEPFRTVILNLEEGRSLAETERAQLGFDHAELGAKVAEGWRFPEKAKVAIAYHHRSAVYRGEYLGVVHCVEVANLICTLKGYCSVGRKLITVAPSVLRDLSLSREHIVVLAQDLDEELARNAALFDL